MKHLLLRLGFRTEPWPWIRAVLVLASVIAAVRVWIPTFNTWWILYGYQSSYDRSKKAVGILLIGVTLIGCLESVRNRNR